MILKDQKNRERVLIAIVSVCMIMLLLVSMIIYIIMEPIKQILVALGLKEGETNDEFNEIQNIRLENDEAPLRRAAPRSPRRARARR